MTTASDSRLLRVSYDPVEDELTVALSERAPGIYVYDLDDGLYACIDEGGNVTHICAERATLGRSSTWRTHLSDAAGTSVVAALEALAGSGEPAANRPVVLAPAEESQLIARWQAIAAADAAARAALSSMPERRVWAAPETRRVRRIAELTFEVRARIGRLAETLGATVESFGTFGTTLRRPIGLIESSGRTGRAAASRLVVNVDRAAELGLEPQGTLDLQDAIVDLHFQASRSGSHQVIAILLDDSGIPVSEPELLAAEEGVLTARLVLERPLAPRDMRMLLLSSAS